MHEFLHQGGNDGFVNKASKCGVTDDAAWNLQGRIRAPLPSSASHLTRSGWPAACLGQKHTYPAKFDRRYALASGIHSDFLVQPCFLWFLDHNLAPNRRNRRNRHGRAKGFLLK